ncbi:MAG: 4Fe-4S binding protein, partial [Dehalococcoidia bacterium]|nr:4Fe-4S binding protein [Dehalococcoidia bacterium]
MTESTYDKLREHYTVGGLYQLPQRKEVLQLLKLRLTPEEADLALMIPVWGRGKTSIAALVEKSGQSQARVEEILAKMLRRGLSVSQKARSGEGEVYCLFDFSYSLYTPLWADGYDDDEKRQVAAVREKMWQAGSHYLDYNSRFIVSRVLPHESTLDPVDKVEPWERVSHYIEQTSAICAVACGCRASTKKCNRPLWSCVHMGEEVDYWVKYRNGRRLSKDEALQVITDAGKAGLVITGLNYQEMQRVFCSCCPDCCLLLRPYIENNNPYSLARSNFMPQFYTDKCKACLTCKDSCPVGAIGRIPAFEEGKKDRMVAIKERCIG